LEKKQPAERLDLLDIKDQAAYFNEIWAYARSLNSEFNDLKAFLFYHCLSFDRDNNTYDYARFIEYLKLPWSIYPHTDRWADKDYDDRSKIPFVHLGGIQIGYLPSFQTDKDNTLLKDYVDNYFGRTEIDSINFFAVPSTVHSFYIPSHFIFDRVP
jgi:hypothetical protein